MRESKNNFSPYRSKGSGQNDQNSKMKSISGVSLRSRESNKARNVEMQKIDQSRSYSGLNCLKGGGEEKRCNGSINLVSK